MLDAIVPITLVAETWTTDDAGGPVRTQTRRTVLARAESIGQKEFYQAAAVGLHPEIRFVLADYLDWQREQLVEFEGATFHVLRTYMKGVELELVCYTEVNPSGAAYTPPQS